eukprot:482959_1
MTTTNEGKDSIHDHGVRHHFITLMQLDAQHREKGIKLVSKVVNKILSNPNKPKYKRLKISIIRNKLLNCEPFIQLLLHAGFKKNEHLLVYTNEQTDQLKALQIMLKEIHDSQSCAKCTYIQHKSITHCMCGNELHPSLTNQSKGKGTNHTTEDAIQQLQSIGYEKRLCELAHSELLKKNQKFDVNQAIEWMDNHCDLERCLSKIRIGHVMKHYGEYDACPNTDNTMYDFINHTFWQGTYNNIEMLNDFQHLLLTHEDDFEDIYNYLIGSKMFGKECDKLKCKLLSRNFRDRQCSSSDKVLLRWFNAVDSCEEISICQTIDAMHCYYLHTLDSGYRLTREEQALVDACDMKHDLANEQSDHIDLKIAKVVQILKSKKTFKNEDELVIAHDSNKFMSKQKKFNLGTQYVYASWLKYSEIQNDQKTDSFADQSGLIKVIPVNYKYSSLKQELLHNAICIISKTQWSNTLHKATENLQSDCCKKSKPTEHSFSKLYDPGINIFSLQYEHLISVILYCGFDLLSTRFSETFRKLKTTESDQALMHRHQNFAYLGRFLRESVYWFGETALNTYYHGCTEILQFEQTVVRFYSPFSTSTDYAVALNFASAAGMMLHLESNYIDWGNSGFSCCWLSSFINEQEVLFFGFASLRILNIVTHLGHNYGIYLSALNIIQHLIRGEYYDSKEEGEYPLVVRKMVLVLLCNELHVYEPAKFDPFPAIPEYIKGLLHHFCITQRVVHIAWCLVMDRYLTDHDGDKTNNIIMQQVTKKGYKFLQKFLCTEDLKFINLKVLSKLLPNVSCVRVIFSKSGKKLNSLQISMIEAVRAFIQSNDTGNLTQIEFHLLKQEDIQLAGLWKFNSIFWTLNWVMFGVYDSSSKHKYRVLTIAKNPSILLKHSEYRIDIDAADAYSSNSTKSMHGMRVVFTNPNKH